MRFGWHWVMEIFCFLNVLIQAHCDTPCINTVTFEGSLPVFYTCFLQSKIFHAHTTEKTTRVQTLTRCREFCSRYVLLFHTVFQYHYQTPLFVEKRSIKETTFVGSFKGCVCHWVLSSFYPVQQVHRKCYSVSHVHHKEIVLDRDSGNFLDGGKKARSFCQLAVSEVFFWQGIGCFWHDVVLKLYRCHVTRLCQRICHQQLMGENVCWMV